MKWQPTGMQIVTAAFMAGVVAATVTQAAIFHVVFYLGRG